jgi:hypothetical protein
MCSRWPRQCPGAAWGALGVSLHRGAGLGCRQGGDQRLGVDGGGVDRSREEGEGFWAGLASGYSLLLDAKQIRQGDEIFRILGLQR